MNIRPDDFEAGEDVTDDFSLKDPESAIVISVRLAPAEAAELGRIAADEGQQVAQTVREAIMTLIKASRKSKPK